VVFGLLTIVLMLSAFFTVHCALELSSAAAEFYSFVNQQFDNKDVREWFQSLGLQTEVQEAIDKIYAWSNKTSPSILKMLKAFNSTYSGTLSSPTCNERVYSNISHVKPKKELRVD